MSEFSPRTEPVAAVGSAMERNLSHARGNGAASAQGGVVAPESSGQTDMQLTERSTVVANYARIQANIANVVAQLDPPRKTGTSDAVAAANKALMDLMPQPVIVLPLPPTDQHMVEFVAQVAQSVAQQAAQARAAQAHVSPDTADTVIH